MLLCLYLVKPPVGRMTQEIFKTSEKTILFFRWHTLAIWPIPSGWFQMPIHTIYIYMGQIAKVCGLKNKIVNVQLIKLSPSPFPCTPPTAYSQKGWLTTLLKVVWILLNYFQVRWLFKIRSKVFLSDVTEETIMSSVEKECLFWLVLSWDIR